MAYFREKFENLKDLIMVRVNLYFKINFMKKIISISLLSVLLLSSCSIDWNDEKAKKISKLENEIKNDIFKKRKECAVLDKEMLEFAQEFRSTIYEVQEIFYSPKRNSCMFIWDTGYEYYLFDYFSRENLEIYKNTSQEWVKLLTEDLR